MVIVLFYQVNLKMKLTIKMVLLLFFNAPNLTDLKNSNDELELFLKLKQTF